MRLGRHRRASVAADERTVIVHLRAFLEQHARIVEVAVLFYMEYPG